MMKSKFIFYKLLVVFLFLISTNTIFGQGTSCANATTLTIGQCIPNSGTININDNTSSYIGAICGGTFRREGWYQVNVTNAPSLITVSASASNRNLALQFFSGDCSTTLNQLACVNVDTNNNSTQTEILQYSVTSNGTYYIRVLNVGNNNNMTLTSLCVSSDKVVPYSSNQAYTMCSGNIYDNGGSLSVVDYANNSDGYTVVYPSVSGNYVQVSGTITTESGYDYLTIYDGVGTTGTVLWGGSPHGSGTSCSSFTIPAITSTTGPLTIRFQSDGSGSCTGFDLNVACIPPCSGTPAAGTASLSPTTGLPSSTFTGSVSGATSGGGITYQWQIGDTATGPWSDIAGATNASQILTAVPLPSTTKYYRRRITCSASGQSSYSNAVSFTTTAPSYCSATTDTPNALYINSVNFVGNLVDYSNTNTGAGANGFQNYTSATPTPTQADGYVMNVIARATGSTLLRGAWKAWVDWNGDGDFSDTGEEVYNNYGYVSPEISFGFVIPTGQTPGKYRLRIRVNNGLTYSFFENFGFDFTSCDSFQDGFVNDYFGETEDYSFNVIYNCPAKITAVNIATTDGHRCGTGSVTLSASGTGVSYEWYSTETSTAVLGTGATFATPSISTSRYYYVVAVSSTGCKTVYRTPVFARVDPQPEVTFNQTSASICGSETPQFVVTASGDKHEEILLSEKFDSGLGNFTNIVEGAYTDTNGRWNNRPSPYVPSNPPYPNLKPAISSGYFGGNFATIITDINRNQNILNHLVTNSNSDTNGFLNLKLDFDLYYYTSSNNVNNAYLRVDYSIDGGGNWINLLTQTTNTGNPNKWTKMSMNLPTNTLNSSQFRLRFSCFSFASTGWYASLAAVDNIKIYGDKPITAAFSWTGATNILYDATCANPLNGALSNSVCIKPSPSDIENNVSWGVTATANFANGCPATKNITINNDSKVWNPDTATNWSNLRWKPTTSLPTADKCVVIKKPVNIPVSFNAFAKSLKIESTGSLNIDSLSVLTVTNAIKNQSTVDKFVLHTDANLIQINDSINVGSMTAERYLDDMDNVLSGAGAQMDYIYWSSPVTGQGLQAFSPGTPANRIYQYNETNDYFNPVNLSVEPNFVSAKGYAIRAETTGVSSPFYTKTYKFKGVPNNGNYSIAINCTDANHGYNLVGNPYPSNIDFEKLHGANINAIYNTAWFWTNNNYTVSQQGSGYSGNNYAVFNGTGGNAPSTPAGAGSYPDGIVKVGQGFIVRKKPNSTLYPNLNFQNSYGVGNDLRVSTPGTFFERSATEKNRFWLQLISPNNMVNTQLIGYVDGATDGFEQDYDNETFSLTSDVFYSILGDKKLLIQGKANNFSTEDQIPVGAKFFQNGNYTIRLDKMEGIFAGSQEIYLKDKLLNTYTNLKEGDYTFSTNLGVTDGRFEIVYKPGSTLATDQSVKANIVVYRDHNDFVVKSSDKNIKELEVYDASGRLIHQQAPNNKEAIIVDQILTQNIYIIKLKLENGEIETVKIRK